jgi:peptide/nickel transport system substrate-binding protein
MTMQHGFFPFSQRVRFLGRFFGLFSLCFLLVVGCNNNQSATNPGTSASANRDRVTVGMTVKPRTLDPADSYEIAGLNAIYNLSDTLYTYEPGTTELKPLLATAMPAISEEGLTYTIPLREGVDLSRWYAV